MTAQKNKTTIFGLCGMTGSGKTYVLFKLKELFKDKVAIISQDQYYKDLKKLRLERFERANYDVPKAFRNDDLIRDLKRLAGGESVLLPQYDFVEHKSIDRQIEVKPAPIILVEGILIFHPPALRRMFDYKIFLYSDPDIRLCRRLLRDFQERGVTLENFKETINYYLLNVKPMQERHVLPLKKYADLVFNTNEGGNRAADELARIIRKILHSPKRAVSLAG